MTVSATVPRAQYTITSSNVTSLASDPASVTFNVTFKYLATSEVVATKTSSGTDTVLTEITHYTLSAAGASGTFTFTATGAALFAADDLLTFTRKMERTSDTFDQLSDYAQNDALDADTLENNFDKAVMIAQQLLEAADRRLHFSATSTFETTGEAAAKITATKANRASKYLGFDANGDITTLAAITGISYTETSIAAGHILRYSGSAWVNSDILALDDTKLYFGTDKDLAMVFDEASDDIFTFSSKSGTALELGLFSDNGEDNSDKWKIRVTDGGTTTFESKISGSYVSHLTITPHATVASSSILAPGRLYFSDIGGEYILGDGTDLTVASGADINFDSNAGTFNFLDTTDTFGRIKEDSGNFELHIRNDNKDLIIKQHDGNEVARFTDGRKLKFFDDGDEYISGDGTDLTIGSGNDLTIDVDGGDVYYKDDGTTFLHTSFDGTNTTITGP